MNIYLVLVRVSLLRRPGEERDLLQSLPGISVGTGRYWGPGVSKVPDFMRNLAEAHQYAPSSGLQLFVYLASLLTSTPCLPGLVTYFFFCLPGFVAEVTAEDDRVEEG